ncbi:putative histone-lysine N-methyltransferase 1 isoform X2 [Ruditapes philippinarum]|uniref:putative histone-lysine N-methyltransferase 1 isoform X2 n=1 Tax=Ruditapes philippinarum TaxID=129788 RepID=UPI00295BC708|nr:putative histone-lysine N-methyltransferase 1 isoform X2 [Ruditapes philippinarum]
MIKLCLFLLISVCYIESKGLVNEFEIEDSNNATIENKTDHRNKTKLNILPSKKEINVTKKHLHNDKNKTRSQIHDTSMYTETDLEETSSQNDLKFDGPNTNDNVANNTKENHDFGNNETEMSNIYTDSDLEATASKDKKKHGETPEKDKKSAGSYLFVPHKREIANSEHEEGSGEGSGNEPLTNDTS